MDIYILFFLHERKMPIASVPFPSVLKAAVENVMLEAAATILRPQGNKLKDEYFLIKKKKKKLNSLRMVLWKIRKSLDLDDITESWVQIWKHLFPAFPFLFNKLVILG